MGIERREQVFVSSTYLDLIEERQEVIQTLLEADCLPAGMELFPASDESRWTLIRRVIDDSDYYIVVVGGRYGSVNPENGLSFTEMEFDYAIETATPVLGFLHGDPGSIVADKSELDEEAREKLSAFREKVEQRIVKYWGSPAELSGQVAKALIQIRKLQPAEGWVRARDAVTPELEADLAELRARNAELTSELERVRSEPAQNTEAYARGDDSYVFAMYHRYHTSKQVEIGVTYSTPAKIHRSSFTTTWNRLLGKLGPAFLDEISEERFRSALDQFAYDGLIEHPELIPDDYGENVKVSATGEVFDDVKVQFFALGLIAQSDKRRPVADSETYWTLTDRGREELMRLRAIRRDVDAEMAVDEAVDPG